MKMKFFILFLFLSISTVSRAEILVIINAENSLEQIEHKQLVDLFMGRVTAFPNGIPAQTLDLPSGTPLREDFYKSLTGKSEAQVDAYWATLVFAGRMSPPKQFPDDQAIINAVGSNPYAIAYVPRQPLPDSVKVITELAED